MGLGVDLKCPRRLGTPREPLFDRRYERHRIHGQAPRRMEIILLRFSVHRPQDKLLNGSPATGSAQLNENINRSTGIVPHIITGQLRSTLKR